MNVIHQIERGDYIILHDCGANSLSVFCRHCSRQAPPVIGRFLHCINN